jgi:peptide-methionine (R)-S-oxide reductase
MSDDPIDLSTLTDEEWRHRLTPEQYRITRQKGTEQAFSGAFWDTKDSGLYRCICCGASLFDADSKYDSGSGWPSFTGASGDVRTEEDRSHGMHRTEVQCATCGAHLGHVFPDGPGPDGMRYCINSASLDLEAGESDSR